MSTILVIVESIALVVGSLAAGILLCWLLWLLFSLAHHPEWGPPLVAAPVILAFAGLLPDSEFLHMALMFSLFAAVPFWVAGKAWRTRWQNREPRVADTLGQSVFRIAESSPPKA